MGKWVQDSKSVLRQIWDDGVHWLRQCSVGSSVASSWWHDVANLNSPVAEFKFVPLLDWIPGGVGNGCSPELSIIAVNKEIAIYFLALYISLNRDYGPSIARMDRSIVPDSSIISTITFIPVVSDKSMK